MTKLRNKLVLVILAICLIACMGIVVACGGDDKPEDKSVTYTVTVKAGDAGAKGVKVTVKKGTVSFAPQTTGDDGKATFKLAEDDGYSVTLENLPVGYELAENATLTFGAEKGLTINLTEKFAYKVKLVNAADNTPFYAEGVSVGICKDGNCLTPVAIGNDGVAKIYDAEKDNYTVQIINLPLQYAYEQDEHNYSVHQNEYGSYYWGDDEDDLYNWLTDEVTEQTIKIYTVNAVDFGTVDKLTDDERATYAEQGINIYGGTAYKVATKVPANSTVYYAFEAEADDSLSLYSDDNAWYTANNIFWLGGNGSYVDKSGSMPLEVKSGNTYYLNITNEGEAEIDARFILATKAADDAELDDAGEATVTVYSKQATAVIKFEGPAGAAYKATVQGDATAAIGYFSYDDYEVKHMGGKLADGAYVKGSNVSFKLTEEMKDRAVYLGVSVKASAYPATVTVKIEKIKDVKNVENVIEVKKALTQYDDADEGKELVPLALDGSVTLVKDGDGNYHVDSATGAPVVVMLTGNLGKDRYKDGGSLIYLDRDSGFWVLPYVVDVTSDEDRASLDKGNTYNDYRFILRGFGDYDYDEINNAKIPTITYKKDYYAKYVNNDGVYPLNDELMDILKAITKEIAAQTWGMLPSVGEEYQWMFACYSYNDYVEADAVVGEYKFVSMTRDGDTLKVGDQIETGWDFENDKPIMGTVTEDRYKLVVEKYGRFVIYDEDGNEELVGTWSKMRGYVFTVPNGTFDEETFEPADLVYFATYDEATGKLDFEGLDGSKWSFKPDAIVGEYNFAQLVDGDDNVTKVGDTTIMGGTVTEDDYKLVIKKDGTFVIYAMFMGMLGEQCKGTWVKVDGVYTFTVPEGRQDEETYEAVDLIFTVTFDAAKGKITLAGDDNNTWTFQQDAIVGEYKFAKFSESGDVTKVGDEIMVWDEDKDDLVPGKVTDADYKLVVTAANTFMIYKMYAEYQVEYSGTWTKVDGKYTFTLPEMDFDEDWNMIDWHFTVTFDEQTGKIVLVADNEAETEWEFQK